MEKRPHFSPWFFVVGLLVMRAVQTLYFSHDALDFTMLDKGDFSPVGYKRVSKETGREVKWDNIVKGYEYEKGRFVVTDNEVKMTLLKKSIGGKQPKKKRAAS